jgi:hypothetical protein
MGNITERKRSWERVEPILLKSKAVAYSLSNLRDFFRVVRLRNRHEGIQLRPAELIKIVHAIGKFERCNLLIFGLGNDSPLWVEANSQGRTVFLEDYKPWYDKITTLLPLIEAYQVSYPCNITQWHELLEQPKKLKMDLPSEVTGTRWDVILVDGPRGNQFKEEIPGRMSSIFMSGRLVGKGGHIFVHDADRNVEKAFSARYLSGARNVEKIRGGALMLHHRCPD